MITRARNYIFGQMPKIRGYLGATDALAIATILIGQTDAQLSGSVAEVGVFFGRSFFLMATLIGENEKAFAADLFDIGSVVGDDQLTCFLKSAKALDVSIDREMMFVGNSHDLSASLLLQKAGPLRFFSIDGGHSLPDVLSDAELAANTISEFGVICFDDFCNPEFPEVTLGAFDFFRKHDWRFVPFAISQKKLYACKTPYKAFYTELMTTSILLRKIKSDPIDIMGHSSRLLRSDVLERARHEIFVRAGLGRVNALFY
jgi:hypothetical protein